MDRILKLDLEKKDLKAKMILEMFGRGNLIITDDRGEIVLALQSHEFADRSIKRGERYIPPKNESVELANIEEIKKVFDSMPKAEGNDRLVAYLSRRIGVGNVYIDDAIRREGLEPKIKIKDVEQKALLQIRDRILKVIESNKSPILYLKEGVAVDAALVELEKYKDLEKREMPLGEAIEAVYYSTPKVEKVDNSEVEKIEASLQRQNEIVLQMQKDEKACRKTGEFISNNIADIGEIIRHAGIKKTTEEDLNKMVKGIRVKKIDRAKRVLIIEKEDAQ